MNSVPTSTDNIIIRPLESLRDFLAFEALQRDTWGKDLAEVVTASLAQIVQKIGGIAAGAFDSKGALLGFIFGFTGFKDGNPIHWSHMLAVRKDVRDSGIGRKLKLYQRGMLLSLGVKDVFWTYDPLVARNAHINFTSLGVEASDYVPNMYGPGGDSELFRGLGTDRFIVLWRIASERVEGVLSGKPAFNAQAFLSSPIIVGRTNEALEGSAPRKIPLIVEPFARVEIPPDIHAVREASPEKAMLWRSLTREAFQSLLKSGYEVKGFYRDQRWGRCFYCLQTKG